MKTSLVVIIVIIYIGLFFFIAYLWRQNRSSESLNEKILSATGVALFGVLTALLFSLKSEVKELNFASTIFFHKYDKKPLDNHLEGDGRLKLGGHQFTGPLVIFINNCLKESEELSKAKFSKDRETIVDFYHNIIFIKLLYQFFWMYSARWDTNIFSVRRGITELKESYIDSEKKPPRHDCLNWSDLLNTEQQNRFYNLLSAFSYIKQTKVPPKTKVSFNIDERKKELVLKNPFVTITISINKSGGSSGLGDYKWLLGFVNDKKSEEFWSAHFRIKCNAKFEKLKSGHPEMPKYKQWVNVMFGEVQYLLDEKEQLRRAYEYRQLIKP